MFRREGFYRREPRGRDRPESSEFYLAENLWIYLTDNQVRGLLDSIMERERHQRYMFNTYFNASKEMYGTHRGMYGEFEVNGGLYGADGRWHGEDGRSYGIGRGWYGVDGKWYGVDGIQCEIEEVECEIEKEEVDEGLYRVDEVYEEEHQRQEEVCEVSQQDYEVYKIDEVEEKEREVHEGEYVCEEDFKVYKVDEIADQSSEQPPDEEVNKEVCEQPQDEEVNKVVCEQPEDGEVNKEEREQPEEEEVNKEECEQTEDEEVNKDIGNQLQNIPNDMSEEVQDSIPVREEVRGKSCCPSLRRFRNRFRTIRRRIVQLFRRRSEPVCREWLIREDGVLAYKLQNEEIEQHYSHNRNRNRLARTDLQEAKTAQQIEEEEAIVIKQEYEQMLQEQEKEDERVAQQLQEQLEKEVLEKKKHVEQEDERLAWQLQEREKQRLERKRLEWELRQVEKARSHQSATTSESPLRSDDESTLSKSLTKTSISSPPEIVSKNDNEADLSDFCLQPPPGLTEVELKKFQEEQDMELARLLQEQETKRKGPSLKDRQLAIEAQDRELARVLQEQERTKARKAKEKARQKALLQQQQEMETIEEVGCASPEDRISRSSLEFRMQQEVDRLSENSRASTSGLPNQEVQNIAMALDPTYNRQKSQGYYSPQSSQLNSQHTSPNRTIPCCPDDSPSNCGIDNGYFENGDEDCEGAVPPYMPIQGQRRTSSLDKGKKKKREKDGCKTQ